MKRKLVLAALLHFVLFATPALTEDTKAYRLSPNDTLEIHVIGRDELTTKQTITPDGTISVPILGRIVVSGKTLFELDSLLESGFAKMVKAPSVVTYLTPWSLSAVADGVPKGIFVVIQDLKKETWSVKEAKTVSEALAWTAGQDFWVNGVKVSRSATLTAPPLIQPGDTVLVKMGEKPSFWEANWYKVLTSLAVVSGIVHSF
jgi:protein involved in polysaccharide export with SLBB domain